MLSSIGISGSRAGAGMDPFDSQKGKIHVRMQQNGARRVTTVQGLDDDLDFARICKAWRKEFRCNGSLKSDERLGEIIILQGDHREEVRAWLLREEIIPRADAEDRLVVH